MKRLLLVLMCLIVLSGCSNKIKYDNPEGEAYDMSGYDIESTHFYNVSYDQVLEMIAQKKTIVVYLGYEDCPWCQELVPILDKVLDSFTIEIYYVDVRSEESLNNKEGLNRLTEYAGQTNAQGELIFFFPSILFIQKGELVNQHIGTVSGHDTNVAKMTEKQIERLEYLLTKKFKEVLNYE